MNDDNTPAGEDGEDELHDGTVGIDARELEGLQSELARVREERLRERADLENQRRRMGRELEQARRYANEHLLEALLPVFDALEAGIAVDSGDAGKLREGMQLTLRQMRKVTTEGGLQVVDPVGEVFDPDRHQAMSAVATAEHAPDTVVQVYQKGYVLNGRLLRPALVVVAKGEA